LINAFLDYLQLEKQYSKHTITAYRNDLNSFKGFLITEYNQDNLVEVHYTQIRSWIVSLVDLKLSNRSINRKISSLKSFYKFLQKIRQIEANPLSKHKALKIKHKVQVPFNVNEVNQVLSNIDKTDDFISVRNKLIVELFYSTGIRRAELININQEDISISNKTVKVIGKRNKERYVPLLNSVLETLINYLKLKETYAKNTQALLITKKGNKVYETLVYRVINSYFAKVSTKEKKSPHILRHSFATHLLNQGADINSVKELLGHSSLASTQVYTNNSLEMLKKVYNHAHPRGDKKK